MLEWIALGIGGYLVSKYIKDGNAEKNSFQKIGIDNYSQYVMLSVVAMPNYETHIYVDGLLFCKTHRQYSPQAYNVNDIPVGCRLTEYHKYRGQDLKLINDIIVEPGPGVEVYTHKRGNPWFDRGLWVNDDGNYNND